MIAEKPSALRFWALQVVYERNSHHRPRICSYEILSSCRLVSAANWRGYPSSHLVVASETLLRRIKRTKRGITSFIQEGRKPAIVPCVRKIPHYLKVKNRHGASLAVFSGPLNLAVLCACVRHADKLLRCEKKHDGLYLKCASALLCEYFFRVARTTLVKLDAVSMTEHGSVNYH